MLISNITQDLLGLEWKEFNDARKDEVLSFLSKMWGNSINPAHNQTCARITRSKCCWPIERNSGKIAPCGWESNGRPPPRSDPPLTCLDSVTFFSLQKTEKQMGKLNRTPFNLLDTHPYWWLYWTLWLALRLVMLGLVCTKKNEMHWRICGCWDNHPYSAFLSFSCIFF